MTYLKKIKFFKASEILLFGKKLTAEEAVERNLVSKVIPSETFQEVLKNFLIKK